MSPNRSDKSETGRFFEEFHLGEVIHHATPRTLTSADQSLAIALYGSRFALHSSHDFAKSLGHPQSPLDDVFVFNLVFGKTVPDISLNAVANLGYAACRFLAPAYPGDTLRAVSEVIGLKENSSRETGVVYVRSQGFNQHNEVVLDYVRWVMVRKRDKVSPAPVPSVPTLPPVIHHDELGQTYPKLAMENYDYVLAGQPYLWDDYTIGEKIDHVDGMTIEEAEHQLATRLYQNTARVHFNDFSESKNRFGKRLVYGGHVIAIARALSFNGLANAFHIAAINGGRHVAPSFAGDTIFAWSRVLDKAEIAGRTDVAALRLRLVATKNRPCSDFPRRNQDDAYDPAVILDLDYWTLMPKR